MRGEETGIRKDNNKKIIEKRLGIKNVIEELENK